VEGEGEGEGGGGMEGESAEEGEGEGRGWASRRGAAPRRCACHLHGYTVYT
jgi:hypothetical protein